MSFIGWWESHPRWVSFLSLSALAAGGTLLAYFRIPGIAARTVWAEDGRVFLTGYLDDGPALFAPYDGYLHLLPRFIVAVVTPVFGLEHYPLAITVASSMVLGLVAALTYFCSSAITSSAAARLCWASIPPLVAPGALETMANAANLHWYLLWLAPWLLIKSPSTCGQKILFTASAIVVALSEIQAAFFLPLVLYRWRDQNLWWARTGLAAGVACQVLTLWRFPRTPRDHAEETDALSLVLGYFLNSSAAVFYGSSSAISAHVRDFGLAPVLLSAVPFVLAATLLIRWGTRQDRFMGMLWLSASVIVWTAAVVANPAPYFLYGGYLSSAQGTGFFLSRYSTLPSMFLLALVPLVMAGGARRIRGTKLSTQVTSRPQLRWFVVGAFALLQTVYFFPVDTARSAGPEWQPQIQAARTSCRADPAIESVDILQAPDGWVTRLSCRNL